MALNYTISKNSLQLLLMYFFGFIRTLTGHKDADDIVFVDIDFENLDNIKTISSQNVAILDTKNRVYSPRNTIPTLIFVTGSPSYCTRNKKLLFGETVTRHQQDMCHSLEALISRTQKNVLVGYEFKHDLSIVQFLKFDENSLFVGFLDVQYICR